MKKQAPFLSLPHSLCHPQERFFHLPPSLCPKSLSIPFSLCLIFEFSPPFSLPFVIQVKEFWSFTWINLQLVLQAETLARRYSSEQFVQFVGKTSNFASSHQVHLTFEPMQEVWWRFCMFVWRILTCESEGCPWNRQIDPGMAPSVYPVYFLPFYLIHIFRLNSFLELMDTMVEFANYGSQLLRICSSF